MKTDKEVFIELLKSSGILYEVSYGHITVGNYPYGIGYDGLSSTWFFNEDGSLISVGHYDQGRSLR